MNMNEIIAALKEDNWREFPNVLREYSRCLYKWFDTPTRCRCNNDKPGVQVCCSVSEFDMSTAYELEVCGELVDGTWFLVKRWGLPADLTKGLSLIPQMLKSWETANESAVPVEDDVEELTEEGRQDD